MLEKDSGFNWFLWLIGFSCLAVISGSFYFFYFQKNYDFIIEVACDPAKGECFERDCSNLDDCPPNGLSKFKRYSLNAADFSKCENEDCTYVCENSLIKCEQIKCVEDNVLGESCSELVSPVTNQ